MYISSTIITSVGDRQKNLCWTFDAMSLSTHTHTHTHTHAHTLSLTLAHQGNPESGWDSGGMGFDSLDPLEVAQKKKQAEMAV